MPVAALASPNAAFIRYGAEWLGPLATEPPANFTCRWRAGFLRTVELLEFPGDVDPQSGAFDMA